MPNSLARPLKLFFDGGCRPNPGAIEVVVVVRGQIFHRRQMGFGTNDEAEWLAALYALEVARGLADDVLLVGDSALVVNQASGASKCRSPRLQCHLTDFTSAARSFARVRLRRVARSHNLAGIALEQARAAV